MSTRILNASLLVLFAMSPALLCPLRLQGQEKFTPNYDESAVPKFTLPELLVTKDGKKVDSEEIWEKVRRLELLEMFAQEMYGPVPATSEKMSWKVVEEGEAVDGLASRKQIEIRPDGPDGKRAFEMLLYVPNSAKKPVPVFVCFNFLGNHTLSEDPAVHHATWASRDESGNEIVVTSEIERGNRVRRFPLETILKRGYALATVHYQAVYPDDVKAVGAPKGDETGAISHWSRGYSQVVDVLTKLPEINAKQIVFLGHSRLGKTSLWAGVNDMRAAIVISNDSGCGGAALDRREYGETVGRINDAFPHWFCENFKKYGKAVNDLPFDQHELLALVAPRPVYVASASEDRWADPKGEFLALMYANPAYELYGLKGVQETEWPGVEQPVGEFNGYHMRDGKHDLLEYDWVQYMNFADKHLGRK